MRANATVISRIGNGLFVAGILVFFLGARSFTALPNYARIGILLPLVYSLPLIYADTFSRWSTQSSSSRINAVGSVVVAVMITLGFLYWLIAEPSARAS
jgi:hypothetical protein